MHPGKSAEEYMATLIQTLQYALAQKEPSLPNETRRIILKEALQVDVLDFLYNHPGYRFLNFYGGTCLHVVYQLNRLSEDIDLDNSAGVKLDDLASDLVAFFRQAFAYPEAAVKTQLGENRILRITLKFPVLNALGLSQHINEALNLKVEVSQHLQIAVIRKTPVFIYGRSFIPAHFSLETMMAGKLLACLERNFQRGRDGATIKGRDFFDLLWFMQQNIRPLEEKLAKEGSQAYSVASAMEILAEKVNHIKVTDLAVDLIPLFERRTYIDAWLESFHDNFNRLVKNYI
jgi:predicted nucleotidyltransferase component of viral defense system